MSDKCCIPTQWDITHGNGHAQDCDRPRPHRKRTSEECDKLIELVKREMSPPAPSVDATGRPCDCGNPLCFNAPDAVNEREALKQEVEFLRKVADQRLIERDENEKLRSTLNAMREAMEEILKWTEVGDDGKPLDKETKAYLVDALCAISNEARAALSRDGGKEKG